MIKKRTESGQILYLIVIAMISLLGFAGLAIDGGRIYSEKRSAQNVADTTAMTAALVIGQNPSATFDQAKTAGRNRAISNGYGPSDPNVDYLTIDIDGPYTDDGFYYLVTVNLKSHIEATFIGIVYNGPLEVEVTAVAKVHPIIDLGFGYAMLGASKDACRAIEVGGNGSMEIVGGGLFSNSNAGLPGSAHPSCQSFYQGGSSSANVTGGGISAVGEVEPDPCDPDGPISPCPVGGMPQLEVPTPPTPVCSTDPADYHGSLQINSTSGLPYLIYPGNYDSIKINGGIVVFNPGLYCISNGISIRGGLVTGNRIMLYMIGGTVDFAANSEILLSAPDNLLDYASPPNSWDGMLIYVDPSNDLDVTISGNTNSGFSGTIYAPSSQCIVIGNGTSLSVASQFICNTILLTGDGTVDLTFDKNDNYMLPSTIDLVQ